MSWYGVDYIFTEYFFNLLDNFIVVDAYLNTTFNSILTRLSEILPFLVKYSIGYCHFYYQLGYGLVFYIYIYRRRKARKTNNWQSFYGNSILNWILFNISIFNKFVFNRNFAIYLKSKITKTFAVIFFWVNNVKKNGNVFSKISNLYSIIKQNVKLHKWTPLFKRTSYISFTTFLRRFTKRK